jgi:SAM-dependent methyltransferase
MKAPPAFFDNIYANFAGQVLQSIREATYGEDIGQTSWVTVQEYDEFLGFLRLTRDSHVLEIASGSGGPAAYLARRAGCRVTGIDINSHGVAEGMQAAVRGGLHNQLDFHVADATQRLPFPAASFDGLLCIDSMNHFPRRSESLAEWRRVLRPGGRAVFTDPVVVTGLVTNEEFAQRSAVGNFVFAPRGYNEGLIGLAGFKLLRVMDVSDNAATVSGRWRDARLQYEEELRRMEGAAQFDAVQKFLDAVQRLTRERRLARVAYFVEKA